MSWCCSAAPGRVPSDHVAAELFFHHVVRQVGDVADHARHAQAAAGHHAVFVEMALVEVGVGDDGAAGHSLKAMFCADKLGAVATATQMPDAIGVLQGPAQGLHAAQTATQYRGQLVECPGGRARGLAHRPSLPP